MGDDSAEILFQPFLEEAIVSSFGKSTDVHSLMMSIQHFLWRPRRRPPSKVPWRMVWGWLLWRVTCLNHASFPLDSCQKTFPWTHTHTHFSLSLQTDEGGCPIQRRKGGTLFPVAGYGGCKNAGPFCWELGASKGSLCYRSKHQLTN